MTKRPLPSPEILRKLLHYEPETGKLFWRHRPVEMFKAGASGQNNNCSRWNGLYANKKAGYVHHTGYIVLSMLGGAYAAHRLIFTIITGEFPPDQIDHINHDRTDNRWENLRAATSQENGKNRSLQCNNTSGITGVNWHKRRKMWGAHIGYCGKKIGLGYFTDKADAIAARSAAETKYEYHPNHGT